MPLTEIRRGLRVIGVIMLIAAPGLSIGSVWSRQRQIKEMEDQMFLPTTLNDPAIRESMTYHLSHLQADEAMKWGPTGDATMGVIGTIAGVVVIAFALRRRT